MTEQTIEEFVEANRDELVQIVSQTLGRVPRSASCDCPLSGTDHTHNENRNLSNDDLAEWVNNVESLYLWALSEGVPE